LQKEDLEKPLIEEKKTNGYLRKAHRGSEGRGLGGGVRKLGEEYTKLEGRFHP